MSSNRYAIVVSHAILHKLYTGTVSYAMNSRVLNVWPCCDLYKYQS